MTLAKRIASRLISKLRAQPRYTELSVGELKNIEYDQQFVEVMQRCLQPGSVCIDGGAHQGQMLAEMCRLAPKAVCSFWIPGTDMSIPQVTPTLCCK